MSWLKKEPVYTMHKPTRKNYTWRATNVFCVDKQWQADLGDMQKFQRYNSGFGYLLCVIDVFFQIRFGGPHHTKKPVVKLWTPSKKLLKKESHNSYTQMEVQSFSMTL